MDTYSTLIEGGHLLRVDTYSTLIEGGHLLRVDTYSKVSANSNFFTIYIRTTKSTYFEIPVIPG